MKKLISILFLLCLIFSFAGQTQTFANGYIYTAINDNMLELSDPLPFTQYGYTYLPYSVFTQNLRVFAAHNKEIGTLAIYNEDNTIIFDLKKQIATDFFMKAYGAAALERNGTIYIPGEFICEQMGFTCSTLPGPTFRIKTSAKLPDTTFRYVAEGKIPDILARYNEKKNPTRPATPDGGTTTTEPAKKLSLYMTFDITAPEQAQSIIKQLARYRIRATFFASPDFIAQNPDILYDIYGNGHGFGILINTSPQELPEQILSQLNNANHRLNNTVYLKTRLMRVSGGSKSGLSQEAEAALGDNGYIIWDYNTDSSRGSSSAATIATNTTTAMENAGQVHVLRFSDGKNSVDALAKILAHVRTNSYTTLAINDFDTPVRF